MHTRERGAAHVNVFFFLVMLVLFLGAVGFAYLQQTDATKLRENNASLRAEVRQMELDVQVYEHYVEDLAKVVGETGDYNGREGFTYETEGGLTQKVLAGAALPSKLQSLMTAFARESGLPESTATPISSLLAGATTALASKDKEITDKESANTALAATQAGLQKSVADANQQKSDEVAQLNQQIAELRQTFTSAEQALSDQLDTLRETVRTKDEQLDEEKNKAIADASAARKAEREYLGKISALAQTIELRNPPQAPDGEVISSSQAAGKAWINIGRRDMLPMGTVFEITNARTGELKGRGRVIDVQAERAEVELFDVADKFDYVVKGDQVSNDLYGRNVRRNIYLLGRFGYPMSKPLVKAALERLGNTVHDSIGPGVDLVILGGAPLDEEAGGFAAIEDTDEYKKALRLNIELAPMHKVRNFLALSGE